MSFFSNLIKGVIEEDNGEVSKTAQEFTDHIRGSKPEVMVREQMLLITNLTEHVTGIHESTSQPALFAHAAGIAASAALLMDACDLTLEQKKEHFPSPGGIVSRAAAVTMCENDEQARRLIQTF